MPELLTLITTDTLYIQGYPFLLKYQNRILRRCGDTSIQPIGIHPKYLFIHPFYFPTQHWITFPKETLCFLWYFCHLYYITIEFPPQTLLKTLQLFQDNYHKPRYCPLDPSHKHLKHFLLWFRSIPIWLHWLKTYQKHTKPKPDPHIILVFHRPCTFLSAIQYFPYTAILQSQGYSLHNTIHDHLTKYGEIQCRIREINHKISSEICILLPSSASLTNFPADYIKQINIDRHLWKMIHEFVGQPHWSTIRI